MTERMITVIGPYGTDHPGDELHVTDEAWRLLMDHGWRPPAVPRPSPVPAPRVPRRELLRRLDQLRRRP
jgi:hypothetical protein